MVEDEGLGAEEVVAAAGWRRSEGKCVRPQKPRSAWVDVVVWSFGGYWCVFFEWAQFFCEFFSKGVGGERDSRKEEQG